MLFQIPLYEPHNDVLRVQLRQTSFVFSFFSPAPWIWIITCHTDDFTQLFSSLSSVLTEVFWRCDAHHESRGKAASLFDVRVDVGVWMCIAEQHLNSQRQLTVSGHMDGAPYSFFFSDFGCWLLSQARGPRIHFLSLHCWILKGWKARLNALEKSLRLEFLNSHSFTRVSIWIMFILDHL